MSLHWRGYDVGLDPEFQADVQGLLGPDADEWAITFGKRTRDQQQALYDKHLAGGPLAAPPGHSAHEYGLAVDFCRLVGTGISIKERWDYDHPAWKRVWDAMDAHPRLRSGYHFQDEDHCQAVKWSALKAEMKAAGTW